MITTKIYEKHAMFFVKNPGDPSYYPLIRKPNIKTLIKLHLIMSQRKYIYIVIQAYPLKIEKQHFKN